MSVIFFIKTTFNSDLNHILNCVNKCDFGTKCFAKVEHFVLWLIPLVALSLLVTFLYGSLVWNMFPQFASSTTSWEGHLGGAAAGIAAAILFRHKGPQQPELFIDEEEEDNSSHPENEEVITNPDQEKKND